MEIEQVSLSAAHVVVKNDRGNWWRSVCEPDCGPLGRPGQDRLVFFRRFTGLRRGGLRFVTRLWASWLEVGFFIWWALWPNGF